MHTLHEIDRIQGWEPFPRVAPPTRTSWLPPEVYAFLTRQPAGARAYIRYLNRQCFANHLDLLYLPFATYRLGPPWVSVGTSGWRATPADRLATRVALDYHRTDDLFSKTLIRVSQERAERNRRILTTIQATAHPVTLTGRRSFGSVGDRLLVRGPDEAVRVVAARPLSFVVRRYPMARLVAGTVPPGPVVALPLSCLVAVRDFPEPPEVVGLVALDEGPPW